MFFSKALGLTSEPLSTTAGGTHLLSFAAQRLMLASMATAVQHDMAKGEGEEEEQQVFTIYDLTEGEAAEKEAESDESEKSEIEKIYEQSDWKQPQTRTRQPGVTQNYKERLWKALLGKPVLDCPRQKQLEKARA